VSPSPSFELESPDHFTAGAFGEPGQRVFYLQAREPGGSLVTLKSEKEQVRVLSEYLSRLLARLPSAREDAPGDLDLIPPVEPAWAVASIGLGATSPPDRIASEASEFVEEGDEPATRFRITAPGHRLVHRAEELMKAAASSARSARSPWTGGHLPASNGHIVQAARAHGDRDLRL
jgi:uncharacterized repeat protein (TIGR03847 family)